MRPNCFLCHVPRIGPALQVGAAGLWAASCSQEYQGQVVDASHLQEGGCGLSCMALGKPSQGFLLEKSLWCFLNKTMVLFNRKGEI